MARDYRALSLDLSRPQRWGCLVASLSPAHRRWHHCRSVGTQELTDVDLDGTGGRLYIRAGRRRGMSALSIRRITGASLVFYHVADGIPHHGNLWPPSHGGAGRAGLPEPLGGGEP
jgi:hypothetical protein